MGESHKNFKESSICKKCSHISITLYNNISVFGSIFFVCEMGPRCCPTLTLTIIILKQNESTLFEVAFTKLITFLGKGFSLYICNCFESHWDLHPGIMILRNLNVST